jgi:hypothetical protein
VSSKLKTENVTLAGLFQTVLSKLGHVAHLIRQRSELTEELQQINDLLQTLPLPTDEYCVACSRLTNAWRYLQAAERGAANWELNLLRQLLRRWQESEAIEVRRRFRRSARDNT